MPAKKDTNESENPKVETTTVESTSKNATAKPAETPKKSNVLKWILLGCGSCLVLFILFFVIVYMGASKLTAPATSKAQEFVADLKDNDIDGAYGKFTDDLKDIVQSKDGFKALLEEDDFKPLKKIEKVNFSCKVVENNDTAYVSGELTLKDGSKKSITIQLKKDGDEWKIDVFSTLSEDTKRCTDRE